MDEVDHLTACSAAETQHRNLDIPSWTRERWQTIVDTMAELLHVPAGLIMSVVGDEITVIVSSRSKDNPYKAGDTEELHGAGLYCETVIGSGRRLLVPNALADPRWDQNPDIKLGMVSYLGFPILWPDKRAFGTLCVLDNKENAYNELYERLLAQFRDLIEHHLQLVYEKCEREYRADQDRVRLDSALRSSEERFRLLAEHAADDFVLHDDTGQILDVNHGVCRSTGYTRDELLQMNVTKLPLDLADCWSQEHWKSLQLGETITITSEYHQTDMESHPVEIRFSCQVLDGRKLFLALVRDISEHVRIEKTLRESEAALAEGQRISRTGSWRWNINTGETKASEENFRIFDRDPSLGTMSVEEYWVRIHPEDRPRLYKLVTEAIAANRAFSFEGRLLMADGSVKDLFTTGVPESDEKGGRWYFGTDMDITERKRTENALRQAEIELRRVSQLTSMGQLAGAIVHEMNQPLAAVATSTEACLRWLERDKPDLEEAKKAISRLTDASRRAAEIIAGLRAMARKSTVEISVFDISAVICEVFRLARDEFEHARVTAIANLKTDVQLAIGDRVQIQLVLHNLIRNGIEAMSEGENSDRQLIVSTENDDAGDVVIAVEDCGTGIDDHATERIFDSLYTTKPNGMGMGLTICRSILEAHGRTIKACRRTDTPGMRFVFTLTAAS